MSIIQPIGGIVDETGLGAFRAGLHPADVLDTIQAHGVTLLRLPVGLGKSTLCDAILADPSTFTLYDLVIYASSSWIIINERPIVRGTAISPVPHFVLQARPKSRCGTNDARWTEFEQSGCTALGKRLLCGSCPANVEDDPCEWPGRFAGPLAEAGLVFLAEQQLVINRSFINLIQQATGAESILLLLDEAKFLDASPSLTLERSKLEIFDAALANVEDLSLTLITPWRQSIQKLLNVTAQGLLDWEFPFPDALNYHAAEIQNAGRDLAGKQFTYLGYTLREFAWSKKDERTLLAAGDVQFIARPSLEGADALVLSAHLNRDYVAHRLGLPSIYSPFEGLRIHHTGSTLLNIRNRMGIWSFAITPDRSVS